MNPDIDDPNGAGEYRPYRSIVRDRSDTEPKQVPFGTTFKSDNSHLQRVSAAAVPAMNKAALTQQAMKIAEQDRQRAGRTHNGGGGPGQVVTITGSATAIALFRYRVGARLDDAQRALLGLPSVALELATLKQELGKPLTDEEIVLLESASQTPPTTQETPK